MIFKVGDTVVYPHHGAALIEAIETRTIKGEQKEYLVLKVVMSAMWGHSPSMLRAHPLAGDRLREEH